MTFFSIAFEYDAFFKDTVMQIEKTLKSDRLRVSKVSSKFRILITFNFAVIYL